MLILSACSSRQRETIAHINQRRIEPGGKLMISYQFSDGNQLIFDSAEVRNSIVPHDSLKLFFSPTNPHDNHLLIP